MAGLNKEQQKAVDAGTHVLDPVHGFVPRLPVGDTQTTKDGVVVTAVTDAPDANADLDLSQQEVIKAEAKAVKAAEKAQS